MAPHLATVLLVASGVCAGVLPAIIALARRWRIYDLPGPLKIHQRPIPRVGGVAMMAGLSAAMLFTSFGALLSNLLPVIAVLLVWSASLADDIRSLPPLLRLAVHFAAGTLFWFGGLRLMWTGIAAVDYPLTCLFVAFIVNSMNLLDGMDGLAAGTGAVACIGFAAIFGGGPSSPDLAVALLGVCAAFLLFNFPPARVFMGDSGSTLLGIVFAYLMLDWVRNQSSPLSLMPVAMFLGLPLTDAALAVLRRFRTRSSPFEGDRDHFYDVLLRRGWSVYRVLAWSCAISGALVFGGWIVVRNAALAPYIAVLSVAGLASSIYLLDSLRLKQGSSEGSARTGPIFPEME